METPAYICRQAVGQFKKKYSELKNIPAGIDYPPEADMGDLAVALPLRAASVLKRSPREIGEELADFLRDEINEIETVEVSGAGFVNCSFKDEWLLSRMASVLDSGRLECFQPGRDKKVLIEFVSANPTGPLHVGHGRGAVYGDVLARLLEEHGYEVSREYYVNDAGKQINRLAESLRLRAREVEGEDIEMGEQHYKGDYLTQLVKDKNISSDDTPEELAEIGQETILDRIFSDLEECDIKFDSVARESEVATSVRLQELLKRLENSDYTYEQEGAIFLASSRVGDDKDRVLIRKNGEPTYFANDLVYHHQKYKRGFDSLIDIWGHDHHGYQQRLLAGLEFLGNDPDILEIELYQLVDLYRGGEPVSMSTRGGEFVELIELVEEVGIDAVRFNFLTKNHNRPLDFDIKVATARSEENPVYYVQYAHTRMAGILRKASGKTAEKPEGKLSPEGHNLILRSLEFPTLLKSALEGREPHVITYELQKLASLFHNYYTHRRVLDPDEPARSAFRLEIIKFLKLVIARGLDILGVSAPERM
jgi:arginyl-tRNA synthetase